MRITRNSFPRYITDNLTDLHNKVLQTDGAVEFLSSIKDQNYGDEITLQHVGRNFSIKVKASEDFDTNHWLHGARFSFIASEKHSTSSAKAHDDIYFSIFPHTNVDKVTTMTIEIAGLHYDAWTQMVIDTALQLGEYITALYAPCPPRREVAVQIGWRFDILQIVLEPPLFLARGWEKKATRKDRFGRMQWTWKKELWADKQ
jgi:hypothetical protein